MTLLELKETTLQFAKNTPYRWRVALPLTAFILFLIAVVRLIWRTPKTITLVAIGSFLLVSAVYWLLEPRLGARWRERGAPFHIGFSLASWILPLALLLGSVYTIDRAGWLWYQVTGYDTVLAQDLSSMVDVPIGDFLEQHDMFAVDPQNDGGILLARGVYDIDETVVIPRGTSLRIEPGAVVRFGAGRSLISYSPIIARGAPEEPIHFNARNRWLKWGAVGIVEAGPSEFEHVIFENGREAFVNGVNFFGALSVIHADVQIEHSRFSNLVGKDGVNVQYGHSRIEDNAWRNIRKDGLD
ncbi:MAG: hypothetical protein ACOC9E_06685, partial [Chloroflexota bacterium]